MDCGEESGEAVHGMTRQPNQFGGAFRVGDGGPQRCLPSSSSAATNTRKGARRCVGSPADLACRLALKYERPLRHLVTIQQSCRTPSAKGIVELVLFAELVAPGRVTHHKLAGTVVGSECRTARPSMPPARRSAAVSAGVNGSTRADLSVLGWLSIALPFTDTRVVCDRHRPGR
jgi:hypothetical protein